MTTSRQPRPRFHFRLTSPLDGSPGPGDRAKTASALEAQFKHFQKEGNGGKMRAEK
jgi:hypothetical protein